MVLPVQMKKEVAENSGETKLNVRPVLDVTEEYVKPRLRHHPSYPLALSILNFRNMNSHDLFDLLPVTTRTGAEQPATSLYVNTQEELKGKQGKQIPDNMAVLPETTKETL